MEVDASNTVMYEGWVSGEHAFSDESSFHGDDQLKLEYEEEAREYDPKDFWDIQEWDIQCIAARAAPELHPRGVKRKWNVDSTPSNIQSSGHTGGTKTSEHQPPASRAPTSSSLSRAFNPYEGEHTAKQLDESTDDFLTRLPPSAVTIATGPWIWVAYPYALYRPLSENVVKFRQTANDALESYLSQKSQLEHDEPGKSVGSITRMLNHARDELEYSIKFLAKKYGVSTGKWMLFPSPDQVDQTWAVITRATLEGRLGCSARVATENPEDPKNARRQLSVYTEDFEDVRDVKRVLKELRRLDVVEDASSGDSTEKTIYYKCDAYTHLDINSKNPSKLKASLYSSRELFADMKKEGSF